jgi:transposase
MHQFDLTQAERRRLEEQLRRAPNVRVYRRTLALLELDHGRPMTDIARMLHLSREAVYRWRDLYTADREPSALVDRRRGGRPPFWQEEERAILQEALSHSPDEWDYKAVNWTVSLLREHIERESGRKPSDSTVRRELHRLDYAWKKSRHVLPHSKSPRALRRQRRIRRKVEGLPPGCAVLFEDETEIHLFPPLSAGWAPRGKEAEVPISGENAQRAIFGALDIKTGRRLLVARGCLCAPDFQAVLRLIRESYGAREVALLLDGASCHTAHDSKALAAQLGITLIWLPPRCPQLNPLDRLWKCAKQKVCANRQYRSIDEQEDRFIEYLRGLSAQEALRKAGLLSQNFWLFRGNCGARQRIARS